MTTETDVISQPAGAIQAQHQAMYEENCRLRQENKRLAEVGTELIANFGAWCDAGGRDEPEYRSLCCSINKLRGTLNIPCSEDAEEEL